MSPIIFTLYPLSIDTVGNTLRLVKPELWRKAEGYIRHFARRKREKECDAALDSKTVVLDDNAKDMREIHKYCVKELECDTHCLQLFKEEPTQYADYAFPMEAMLHDSKTHVYECWDTICDNSQIQS